MILYSANFGNKDKVHTPKFRSDNIQFVYFTDIAHDSDVWDVRVEPDVYKDPRKTAKWYKLHPHLLFPGEDTIWIDGNYNFTKDPTSLLDINKNILLFEHPVRDCVYEEAKVCNKRKAGPASDINKQIAFYRKEGFPEHWGLFQGNTLIRKHSDEATLFNTKWWKMINLFSIRDQLSMPYVLWKKQIPFEALLHQTKRIWFFKSGKHKFHGTR